MRVLTVPALLEQLSVEAGVAVVRDGTKTIVAAEPAHVRIAHGAEGFRALDEIEDEGGWSAGYLAYDLGRAVDRVVPWAAADRSIPDVVLARFDARVVFSPGNDPVVEGHGSGRVRLEQALWSPRRSEGDEPPVGLDQWTSSLDRAVYTDAVKAIHGLLDAGECYQVNLTRRLSSPRAVDPRALFLALARHNPAPHAALLTFGPEAPYCPAVVSASPELFLARRGDRVTTRPIKGTHAEAATLLGSDKDRAEHVMIVDLARNDLGRVCVPGTVRTLELAALEAHPGLFHLVSTIEGRLRPGTGLADLVHATFPPASITGAPKPRVMQAIEDLEPVRRGVYCGGIGWIDAEKRTAELSVAIRTFTITHGHTDLGVGGGIVADSDPASEWAETELKVARLLAAAPIVIVWIDGELLDISEAHISPLDRGLVVGDGVFETLRVYHGVPFAWRRHVARLAYSAGGLGLAIPDPDDLRAAADSVLEANHLVDARLRVTVTGGVGPPGSSRGGAVPTAFVVAVPFAAGAPTTRVALVPWTRNERSATAGLKTISYAANVRALAYAEERGAEEALFANTAGNLCEATGSNVFVVRDGAALTPPASAGCLLGVTRGLLLELAPACGVEAREADIPMDELASVSEIFLTSTTREVQAVGAVLDPPRDDRALTAPGPIATCLAQAFRELVASDLDP